MLTSLLRWFGLCLGSVLLLGLHATVVSAQSESQPYTVVFSTTDSHDTMVPLDGVGVMGTVQITVTPKVTDGILEMWLNDPAMSDPLNRLERMAPSYNASGKTKGPVVLDSDALPVGHHTVMARIRSDAGEVSTVSASFSNLPDTGHMAFDRSTHEVPFPTAMAWGADKKLYVTEMLGVIHALEVDRAGQVTQDDTLPLPELAGRLTLGIAEDPSSRPDRIVLWVSHSGGDPDPISKGAINSGTVSRVVIEGDRATIEDVIVGLPRAIANHAINGIHFDTAGRLLIAMGGSTGAGAPNLGQSEFGSRPEQPLSGAVLVADVNAPGFSGICGTPGCKGPGCASWVDDATGTADHRIPDTCDVRIFASGTRNLYDFLVHSNGNIYGADNGLGVSGSFPVSTGPDCTGFASDKLIAEGGQNPGVQGDPLLLLEEGGYYGHPNPQRGECIFKDGREQGVAPADNWRAPIFQLGAKTSSNGIVEYPRDVGCIKMEGDVLITTYSRPDNITRTKLSRDGRQVLGHGPLVEELGDPLPLIVREDGLIFVGEFTNDELTTLTPRSLGCWRDDLPPVPRALLDAGGAATDGKFYMVGGKTRGGTYVPSLFAYDLQKQKWEQGPNLPGPAVENPAVVASAGKLYVFGGSTKPFSGAVARAAMFDPESGEWSALPDLPTPRAGAVAQEIDGLIYVVGGLSAKGASLDVLEVFDTASGTWRTDYPPMSNHRDNPGGVVLDGKLYVFGGRKREASGKALENRLRSVEVFDPETMAWKSAAPMPTKRRAMIVASMPCSSNAPDEARRCAVVAGGERGPHDETFRQTEEYDPVLDNWTALTPMRSPRHGAAFASHGDKLFVAGGGPRAGSTAVDVFSQFEF